MLKSFQFRLFTAAIPFAVAMVVALAIQSPARSDDSLEDHAYLDQPYRNHIHPRKSRSIEAFDLLPAALRTTASNTRELIGKQSSVKAQGARGTCSIFSAIALFESMLIIARDLPSHVDYSEEWLEYLVTRNSQSDGSSSWANFSALFKHGTPDENVLPYIGETWESLASSPLANDRCGKVPSNLQKSCLIAHRDPRLLAAKDEDLLNRNNPLFDPEFSRARKAAGEMKLKLLAHRNEQFSIPTTDEIKNQLTKGIPLTLDIDFYYGAWNHRKATELGLQRNMNHWSEGIVGYPETGSLDVQKSREDPAGHSIVIVGYDNNVVVETTVQMVNGGVKTFKHKGVYYFKNSWGAENFGKDFEVDQHRFPGYGMITQDYAHDYGSFFHIELTQ